MDKTYKVIRYWYGSFSRGGPVFGKEETKHTGLTLSEARKKCKSPSAANENLWFEGYALETKQDQNEQEFASRANPPEDRHL